MPETSIIIPTLNEAANLPLLLPRIAAAMGERSYEVLIIDDQSRDATPQVCADLARQYPLKLIVREELRDGLSGAVLYGISLATSKNVIVMDADLQHPPEVLPTLADLLQSDQADFVVGSRHVEGSGVDVEWSLFRRINSWVADRLARPFSHGVRDPMSGFFGLHRSLYLKADALSPLGYKICLELLCKCRPERIVEVPIRFGQRAEGESKLSPREQARYLEHLSRLYDHKYPRAAPLLKFFIVLLAGWCVALGILLILALLQAPYTPSVIASYAGVILMTAAFHMRFVRTDRSRLVTHHPWRDFAVIAAGEWLACAAAALLLADRLKYPSWRNIMAASFLAAAVVRYILRKEMLQDLREPGEKPAALK